VENARVAKMQGWKAREWKTRHQTAGVENAGAEIAAPDCRGGKRGSNDYEKPKFPLFNIVTSGLQPIELM